VAFCLTLVFVLGVVLVIWFAFGYNTPWEYDTYDKTFWRKETASSAADVFPEKDEINGEIIDFHYKTHLVGGRPEIYLEVVYDEKNFNAEIDRLENISFTRSNGDKKTIKKDESYLFNYTTYIVVYNESGIYEYACVDPTDYRIVYICIRYRLIEEITFDHKYLPKTYYWTEETYNDPDHEKPDPYYFNYYLPEKDNMPY
jgi:hypothetical protein